jgi:membrane-associated phospholipid phosphatase
MINQAHFLFVSTLRVFSYHARAATVQFFPLFGMRKAIAAVMLVLTCGTPGIADDCSAPNLLPPAWDEAIAELPITEDEPRGWFDKMPLEPRNRVDEAPWLFDSWVGTAALGLGLVGARSIFDGPEEANWHGGVLFDDRARNALRAGSEDQRDWAAELSGLTVGSLVAWVAIDNALTKGRANQADAWRMTLDAFFAQGISETTFKHVAGRQRPDLSNNRSFYSGHAAGAATGAGLLCAHHLHGELYGSRKADTLACAGAVSAAFVTGLLRVVADKHYLTDVLVGWSSGFVFGYVLPTRWYYRTKSTEEGVAISLAPAVSLEQASLAMTIHW